MESEPEEEEAHEPEPVPEVRDTSVEPVDTQSFDTTSLGSPSPRPRSRSKGLLVVERDTSSEISPPIVPPSPFSAVALTSSPISNSNSNEQQQQQQQQRQITPPQPSPSMYPMRLSVATPNQLDRSPSTTNDWHDDSVVASVNTVDVTPKRGGEGAWERMKNAFSRSNSSSGRRSRTNSIGGARERRYNTDSSVSRESGASQLSPKEKGEAVSFFAQQQQQQAQSQGQSQGQTQGQGQASGQSPGQAQSPPLMQTPSASASILF